MLLGRGRRIQLIRKKKEGMLLGRGRRDMAGQREEDTNDQKEEGCCWAEGGRYS